MIKIRPQGRLGNQLLQNVGASILAKKFNYKVDNFFADYESKILGFKYYSGNIINENYKKYYDKDFLDLLNGNSVLENGIFFDGYFQIKDFILNYKDDILKITGKVKHEDKIYNKVFVHIRLDDVKHMNVGYEYYYKCLKNIDFVDGYIATDEANHPMINKLVNTFNLKLYNDTPVNTINFGSRFDNIILSHGTFSWWIGFLSNDSHILFPQCDLKNMWHGDIFVYPDWNSVE